MMPKPQAVRTGQLIRNPLRIAVVDERLSYQNWWEARSPSWRILRVQTGEQALLIAMTGAPCGGGS